MHTDRVETYCNKHSFDDNTCVNINQKVNDVLNYCETLWLKLPSNLPLLEVDCGSGTYRQVTENVNWKVQGSMG